VGDLSNEETEVIRPTETSELGGKEVVSIRRCTCNTPSLAVVADRRILSPGEAAPDRV